MWQQVEGAPAVGMVGLGLMEHPMAANILRSGFAVHITGRTRDKYRDLIEAGAFWHNTPRLARQCGHCAGVNAAGPAPGRRGAGRIRRDPRRQLLSPAPHHCLDLVSDRGPKAWPAVGSWDRRQGSGDRRRVSGGSEGAQAGTLSIMVGGEQRDVNDAWPVLVACGNPVHLGPLRSGQVAKACNQMVVAATILALGEAAVLADRSGIDLDQLFRLLAGGYSGSRILATRADRVVRRTTPRPGPPDIW